MKVVNVIISFFTLLLIMSNANAKEINVIILDTKFYENIDNRIKTIINESFDDAMLYFNKSDCAIKNLIYLKINRDKKQRKISKKLFKSGNLGFVFIPKLKGKYLYITVYYSKHIFKEKWKFYLDLNDISNIRDKIKNEILSFLFDVFKC